MSKPRILFLLNTALALLVLFALSPAPAAAQSVDISGFIKSSYYYDTRQVVAAREGDFLLYPTAADTTGTGTGEDKNDTSNTLFFPFFSRLAFAIGDLPDALGAKITGLIETDFYGAGNGTLNSLRMRRGFVKLDWGTKEAVLGMDWTPAFLGAWPRTIATEAGAPYQPFARFPQARFTFKPEGFRLTGLIAEQRDAFAEISGPKAQQQSGLPTLMLFGELKRDQFVLGAGAWTKWVRPSLTADRFNAVAYQGYLQWMPERFVVRGKVTYGEDLVDHIMTGGFVIDDAGEAITLKTLGTWAEVETVGDGFNVGLFGGYFANLGAGETVNIATPESGVNVFTRGTDIEKGIRVSPRVSYTEGRVKFAFELSVDQATYADALDSEFKPSGETESFTNVRGNFSVFLFF